jgi:hypothetical protein
MQFEAGVKPGKRPSASPYSNTPPGAAKLNKIIDNIQLAEWIEDSKYAFLVKEYEDVQRDVVALTAHILKVTLIQLVREFNRKKRKKKR